MSPTCRTCGAEIQIPEGWSVGPAVRRHYWEVHPERMQQSRPSRMSDRDPDYGGAFDGRTVTSDADGGL